MQSEVLDMKIKIKVFALLTVLLCVFAVSALADIEGVQLWEGGLYYAKTPLLYSFDNKPVYLVKVNSTGDMVVDYNDYYSEDQRPISDYDIPDGWRIPTQTEMTYLFDTVDHVTSINIDKNDSIKCTITGKNGNTLTLDATGTVQTESQLQNPDTEACYATTGQFLFFDKNSSPYELVPQYYGGQVILVKDPTVTVTFNTNGGSAVDPQTFDYGKTATKPADPTQTGMTFTGWFTDADCTNAYDFSTPVTKNTTLYAGWAAVPVTVTFESNGGSAVDPQTFDYGKTATKPADPTRTGMTFTGWFTDADCTKAYDFSTPVTKNTTLYAGWLAASPTPTPTPTSTPTPAPTPTPTPTLTPTPTPIPTPTPTPTSEPDPIIIEGQNSEWSKDSQYGLKFRSDADYELFIRVEVDDKTVDPTNYTSARGSTVIFLKPSFLQSLAGGKHKLAIVSGYKSGEKKAITSFTIKVPPLPPTGDSTPIALLTLLCLVSLGTVGLIQKKKKHN